MNFTSDRFSDISDELHATFQSMESTQNIELDLDTELADFVSLATVAAAVIDRLQSRIEAVAEGLPLDLAIAYFIESRAAAYAGTRDKRITLNLIAASLALARASDATD